MKRLFLLLAICGFWGCTNDPLLWYDDGTGSDSWKRIPIDSTAGTDADETTHTIVDSDGTTIDDTATAEDTGSGVDTWTFDSETTASETETSTGTDTGDPGDTDDSVQPQTDTGPTDTGTAGTGTTDTGTAGTGTTDTGTEDTGTEDTGPTDTGTADTGPADTDPVDTDPVDTDPGDTDTYKPWEPEIDDTSYWKPYYPDTVVIYRNDTDDYVRGNFIDEDGDGFGWEIDCNDKDPNVFPGQMEYQDNEKDDNCNCKIDEDPIDYAPTDDCPTDWWEWNFKHTTHLEWALPGVDASFVAENTRACFDFVGHSWKTPTLEQARDLLMQKMGIDPTTGAPSDAEGSCWCTFPWGGDACGPPVWIETFQPHQVGIMRCDAYIKDIAHPGAHYLSPGTELYPDHLVSGVIRSACVRRMPNGIR